ncbi:MAG TPA: hypothetical protein VG890_04290 [Puia sp.]|nr:hypothetical protein [Puia sp.]
MEKKNILASLLRIKTAILIALTVLISLTTLAQDTTKATRGQAVISSTTVTATVLKVNQKTREVTIKTEDGQEHTFVAGKNVRNLAQVKKGDIITANYTEALAYEIREHGETALNQAQAAARADSGARPAALAAQKTTLTVRVTAIDPSAPSVTFIGPRGNTKTLIVKDPQKLNGVKVGDLVDITYTEAIGIKVDPKPKKD